MIARLIHWSIGNRFLVLLATVMLTAWGVVSMLRTPLDALPDLSDTHPGHHPHQLARPGAADRREPGHLPADHHHAVGARGQGGAGLLPVR